jgi:hypothetical protein
VSETILLGHGVADMSLASTGAARQKEMRHGVEGTTASRSTPPTLSCAA